ncbi:Vmc-like lipoprotein signal peptide domain-containing protein [Spiroplasma ixodetis]|nr:hypothetical protein [Spiroplasma ixodetis]
MKKPLLFMGALLLSSAVTASTTACNNLRLFSLYVLFLNFIT